MLRDIVLVHGGGQGGWIWDETVAAIRAQAGPDAGRIFALDVPGCGTKHDRDTSGLSTPEVIAELSAELDARDVRDALLVGHSMAGTLLPGLVAAAPPDRFARVAYYTCAAPSQGQTIQQMMGRGVHGTAENEVGWPLDPVTTPPADLFRSAFCNDMDPAMADSFMARLFKDNWPAACGDSWSSWAYDAARHVPATYIVALGDRILPVSWQERFAARLNAERLVYIDSGHQGMNSRPHSLAEIVIVEARRAG